MSDESLVVNVDEAAELLRVDRKTLYAAIAQGHVPGVIRLGRSIRIGRAALIGWLAAGSSPALEE